MRRAILGLLRVSVALIARPPGTWRTFTMAKVYRSGLDWSGDPGDPSKTGSSVRLAFAAAHILEDELPRLDDCFALARRARSLPPSYTFPPMNTRLESATASF